LLHTTRFTHTVYTRLRLHATFYLRLRIPRLPVVTVYDFTFHTHAVHHGCSLRLRSGFTVPLPHRTTLPVYTHTLPVTDLRLRLRLFGYGWLRFPRLFRVDLPGFLRCSDVGYRLRFTVTLYGLILRLHTFTFWFTFTLFGSSSRLRLRCTHTGCTVHDFTLVTFPVVPTFYTFYPVVRCPTPLVTFVLSFGRLLLPLRCCYLRFPVTLPVGYHTFTPHIYRLVTFTLRSRLIYGCLTTLLHWFYVDSRLRLRLLFPVDTFVVRYRFTDTFGYTFTFDLRLFGYGYGWLFALVAFTTVGPTDVRLRCYTPHYARRLRYGYSRLRWFTFHTLRLRSVDLRFDSRCVVVPRYPFTLLIPGCVYVYICSTRLLLVTLRSGWLLILRCCWLIYVYVTLRYLLPFVVAIPFTFTFTVWLFTILVTFTLLRLIAWFYLRYILTLHCCLTLFTLRDVTFTFTFVYAVVYVVPRWIPGCYVYVCCYDVYGFVWLHDFVTTHVGCCYALRSRLILQIWFRTTFVTGRYVVVYVVTFPTLVTFDCSRCYIYDFTTRYDFTFGWFTHYVTRLRLLRCGWLLRLRLRTFTFVCYTRCDFDLLRLRLVTHGYVVCCYVTALLLLIYVTLDLLIPVTFDWLDVYALPVTLLFTLFVVVLLLRLRLRWLPRWIYRFLTRCCCSLVTVTVTRSRPHVYTRFTFGGYVVTVGWCVPGYGRWFVVVATVSLRCCYGYLVVTVDLLRLPVCWFTFPLRCPDSLWFPLLRLRCYVWFFAITLLIVVDCYILIPTFPVDSTLFPRCCCWLRWFVDLRYTFTLFDCYTTFTRSVRFTFTIPHILTLRTTLIWSRCSRCWPVTVVTLRLRFPLIPVTVAPVDWLRCLLIYLVTLRLFVTLRCLIYGVDLPILHVYTPHIRCVYVVPVALRLRCLITYTFTLHLRYLRLPRLVVDLITLLRLRLRILHLIWWFYVTLFRWFRLIVTLPTLLVTLRFTFGCCCWRCWFTFVTFTLALLPDVTFTLFTFVTLFVGYGFPDVTLRLRLRCGYICYTHTLHDVAVTVRCWFTLVTVTRLPFTRLFTVTIYGYSGWVTLRWLHVVTLLYVYVAERYGYVVVAFDVAHVVVAGCPATRLRCVPRCWTTFDLRCYVWLLPLFTFTLLLRWFRLLRWWILLLRCWLRLDRALPVVPGYVYIYVYGWFTLLICCWFVYICRFYAFDLIPVVPFAGYVVRLRYVVAVTLRYDFTFTFDSRLFTFTLTTVTVCYVLLILVTVGCIYVVITVGYGTLPLRLRLHHVCCLITVLRFGCVYVTRLVTLRCPTLRLRFTVTLRLVGCYGWFYTRYGYVGHVVTRLVHTFVTFTFAVYHVRLPHRTVVTGYVTVDSRFGYGLRLRSGLRVYILVVTTVRCDLRWFCCWLFPLRCSLRLIYGCYDVTLLRCYVLLRLRCYVVPVVGCCRYTFTFGCYVDCCPRVYVVTTLRYVDSCVTGCCWPVRLRLRCWFVDYGGVCCSRCCSRWFVVRYVVDLIVVTYGCLRILTFTLRLRLVTTRLVTVTFGYGLRLRSHALRLVTHTLPVTTVGCSGYVYVHTHVWLHYHHICGWLRLDYFTAHYYRFTFTVTYGYYVWFRLVTRLRCSRSHVPVTRLRYVYVDLVVGLVTWTLPVLRLVCCTFCGCGCYGLPVTFTLVCYTFRFVCSLVGYTHTAVTFTHVTGRSVVDLPFVLHLDFGWLHTHVWLPACLRLRSTTVVGYSCWLRLVTLLRCYVVYVYFILVYVTLCGCRCWLPHLLLPHTRLVGYVTRSPPVGYYVYRTRSVHFVGLVDYIWLLRLHHTFTYTFVTRLHTIPVTFYTHLDTRLRCSYGYTHVWTDFARSPFGCWLVVPVWFTVYVTFDLVVCLIYVCCSLPHVTFTHAFGLPRFILRLVGYGCWFVGYVCLRLLFRLRLVTDCVYDLRYTRCSGDLDVTFTFVVTFVWFDLVGVGYGCSRFTFTFDLVDFTLRYVGLLLFTTLLVVTVTFPFTFTFTTRLRCYVVTLVVRLIWLLRCYTVTLPVTTFGCWLRSHVCGVGFTRLLDLRLIYTRFTLRLRSRLRLPVTFAVTFYTFRLLLVVAGYGSLHTVTHVCIYTLRLILLRLHVGGYVPHVYVVTFTFTVAFAYTHGYRLRLLRLRLPFTFTFTFVVRVGYALVVRYGYRLVTVTVTFHIYGWFDLLTHFTFYHGCGYVYVTHGYTHVHTHTTTHHGCRLPRYWFPVGWLHFTVTFTVDFVTFTRFGYVCRFTFIYVTVHRYVYSLRTFGYVYVPTRLVTTLVTTVGLRTLHVCGCGLPFTLGLLVGCYGWLHYVTTVTVWLLLFCCYVPLVRLVPGLLRYAHGYVGDLHVYVTRLRSRFTLLRCSTLRYVVVRWIYVTLVRYVYDLFVYVAIWFVHPIARCPVVWLFVVVVIYHVTFTVTFPRLITLRLIWLRCYVVYGCCCCCWTLLRLRLHLQIYVTLRLVDYVVRLRWFTFGFTLDYVWLPVYVTGCSVVGLTLRLIPRLLRFPVTFRLPTFVAVWTLLIYVYVWTLFVCCPVVVRWLRLLRCWTRFTFTRLPLFRLLPRLPHVLRLPTFAFTAFWFVTVTFTRLLFTFGCLFTPVYTFVTVMHLHVPVPFTHTFTHVWIADVDVTVRSLRYVVGFGSRCGYVYGLRLHVCYGSHVYGYVPHGYVWFTFPLRYTPHHVCYVVVVTLVVVDCYGWVTLIPGFYARCGYGLLLFDLLRYWFVDLLRLVFTLFGLVTLFTHVGYGWLRLIYVYTLLRLVVVTFTLRSRVPGCSVHTRLHVAHAFTVVTVGYVPHGYVVTFVCWLLLVGYVYVTLVTVTDTRYVGCWLFAYRLHVTFTFTFVTVATFGLRLFVTVVAGYIYVYTRLRLRYVALSHFTGYVVTLPIYYTFVVRLRYVYDLFTICCVTFTLPVVVPGCCCYGWLICWLILFDLVVDLHLRVVTLLLFPPIPHGCSVPGLIYPLRYVPRCVTLRLIWLRLFVDLLICWF